MKKETHSPYSINSISELHRLLQLPKPKHPLVSVINLNEIKCHFDESIKSFVYNFYSICTKKDFKGKLKYGQNYYDFDEGIMTFFSPGQVISTVVDEDIALSGIWLVVHPDFIQNYALAKSIKDYGFFSYAVNEALHLSDKEEAMITDIMQNIDAEYCSVIDGFSQDVILSHIELLLNYSNRFYNRQFITRKNASNDLLSNLEKLLLDYFNGNKVQELGLPTVLYISEQLNVSPNYLSDMLRSLTGQSTQQHIHDKLIEKAKEILTTTSLSVSEIAYQLGFEYPQSFSKLFKSKTNVSPLEFRSSFN
ncbi:MULTISPECIES: AraC family transcriptional regulator [unclassified Flavobacterium]|uniref:helix-turn-helix domain-containing protein n=1 Tax=unclassified Flavobacterium TaxID=196869 RepID=UPI000C17A496|nr:MULTISPECIES: helix-turn-helix transcriptional regulator [unclassified Flavobacterium]PIF62432.1 AraC family transcriptional regulator [Flavobacterium sp. 11]WKL43576.1 helix-turn-helix transcriptional regulator [Flavobacterium sp. ZE23DGlu08]